MQSNKPPRFESVEHYHNGCDTQHRAYLKELHAIIQEVIPSAEPCIKYNMPAFYDRGVVVYYASYKNHIGLYPTPRPIEVFKEQLRDYKTSKGAIQFPYTTLPKDLIQEIIKTRYAQMKKEN